jgi:hypothetical protein
MSRDNTIIKEEEKLSKDEKRYLNSKARVAKHLIISIVEYVIVIILMLLVTTYMQYGSLDNFIEDIQHMGDWFRPGGMMFNAIVGLLPIIAIGCIGVYFGEGTVGKMAFGLIKGVAIILWLVLVFQGASTSLSLPEIFEGMGLEELRVGMDGLVKFLVLVFLCCLLIPIGEFCGARKKHLRAAAHKDRLDEDKDF